MGKKIVFVHGSPRKNGNTRLLTERVMDAAKKQDGEIFEIDAVALKFNKPGCIGCEGCKRTDEYKCVIDDEVGRAVGTLADYDTIVIATPIYWWSYSAQIKIFIDRMYSLLKFTEAGEVNSNLKGKTLALITTGGGGYRDNLDILEQQLKQPADGLGCNFMSFVVPDVSIEPGSIADNEEVMSRAVEFGNELAK